MARAEIPVDLLNPGQVFACLGFLEAADVLLGGAEGGFDWTRDGSETFALSAERKQNPFEAVLEFLAEAEVKALAPPGWRPKARQKKGPENDMERRKQGKRKERLERELAELVRTDCMPSRAPETTAALPVQLSGVRDQKERRIALTHWADSNAGRKAFKLYAGNRTALDIAIAMIAGTRAQPRRGQNISDLVTGGVTKLWEENRAALTAAPFDVVTPMGGSFNFDPRGAWTAIDAGYSPNEHKHAVQASPVVEILAAWGLEHARPIEFGLRQVRYAVWGLSLPPMLARAALSGSFAIAPLRRYRFELDLSGKNKVVTYAQEEPRA
jgi:CRISPR-associated protein Csx14